MWFWPHLVELLIVTPIRLHISVIEMNTDACPNGLWFSNRSWRGRSPLGLEMLHIQFRDQTTPTVMFCSAEPMPSSRPWKTKKSRLKKCVFASTGLVVVLRNDLRHGYFFCAQLSSGWPQIFWHEKKAGVWVLLQAKQDQHL